MKMVSSNTAPSIIERVLAFFGGRKGTPTASRIQAEVVWRVGQDEESDKWVGYCEGLAITVQADSLDELHSLIPETMALLVQDLVEEGDLEEFLRLKGVRYSKSENAETPGVSIPCILFAAGQDDFERATA